MIERDKIDNLATRLIDVIPQEIKSAQKSLQQAFVSVLQSAIQKMDLVTREEFDVQSKILARTREKLEVLEKQIANLEQSD